MSKLIIISGPTASGKTSISIEIAKTNLNAVIVNFDSLLFYKEISIGTAKPSLEEQSGIPHYMIDIESISSPINAAEFIKRAETLIKDLLHVKKNVILVGGSAFYLRALLKGMYQSPPPPKSVKERIDKWYKNEGINPFLDFLKQNDPEALLYLHANDHYRIIRAVEHFEVTGTKISDQKNKLDELNPYDFSSIIHTWNFLHIYLDLPKDEHFKIITRRTEKMFELGLINEIENLVRQGFSLTEKPLASIGYKEAIDFRKGAFKNREECIERIAISTRQLAKSQRTFFSKITPKECFHPIHDKSRILERAKEFFSQP